MVVITLTSFVNYTLYPLVFYVNAYYVHSIQWQYLLQRQIIYFFLFFKVPPGLFIPFPSSECLTNVFT